MAVPRATNVACGRFAHSHAVGRWLGIAGLTAALLLPVWWWPLVASQDGPSHLYNASILNESLAGSGPSLSAYEVKWTPVPNWGGALVLLGLLKVLPLSAVPRVMLSLTALAPMLALLWLHRQPGRSQGVFWTSAIVGCLAAGRAWIMGFEGFSLGAATALCVIGVYDNNREQLNLARTFLIAALLTLTYFCHLVPWAFAVFAIAVLSLTGPWPGAGRRLAWTGGFLLSAVPCVIFYHSIRTSSAGGFELDWKHLQGFHLFGIRSWLRLIGRADCISIVNHRIPFTNIGASGPVANPNPPATHVIAALGGLLFNPFALIALAMLVQAIATFVVDFLAKDYRRVGWFVLGLGGMTLALFIPDGTPRNGTFLPFRIMFLSLAILVVFVRFEGSRLVRATSGLLVTVAFTLHATAIWDYAATANRQLLEARDAAAVLPSGQCIFQIGTNRAAKFQADPVLHADSYVALWTRGVLLSNYEAAHYYFPVKLRPEYPPTLVSQLSQLQELDPKHIGDRALVRQFLDKHREFIDALIVRTGDEQFVRFVKSSFGDLLWHSGDLWVFGHKGATTNSQNGQARKVRQ